MMNGHGGAFVPLPMFVLRLFGVYTNANALSVECYFDILTLFRKVLFMLIFCFQDWYANPTSSATLRSICTKLLNSTMLVKHEISMDVSIGTHHDVLYIFFFKRHDVVAPGFLIMIFRSKLLMLCITFSSFCFSV